MDEKFKHAKCGKRIGGYGLQHLKQNVDAHEAQCSICLGTKIETIKANVDSTQTIKADVQIEKPVELDLNGDGKFDKKDASIAGKVMAAMGRKKRASKGDKK